MRLIDANALHKEISEWPESVMYKDWVQCAIANAPTIAPPPNAPLTMDEMLEMEGDPVWVETPEKSDCCNGLSTVKLTAPWKPGGLKPHVLIVSQNGDRNYAELLMVGFGGKIYRCRPKEEAK